jgi:hypothetical protein
MSCEGTCFEINLPECFQYIKVKGGLASATEYFMCIKDQHGNEYADYVTTDAHGDFIIDSVDEIFPSRIFNSSAGAFELRVWKDYPYYADPEPFNFCGNDYDSILMRFTRCYSSLTNKTVEIVCTSI